jgi:hypothetical protein
VDAVRVSECFPVVGFAEGAFMMKKIGKKIIIVIPFILLGLLILFISDAFGWMTDMECGGGIAILENNRKKWEEAHIGRYRMTVEYSGFGTYPAMPWTLEVKNGKAIFAINAQGDAIPVDDDVRRFTVGALFEDIRNRYVNKAPSVEVSYDQTYGYPRHISINPYAEPCCQCYAVEINNFQIIPDETATQTTRPPRMICTQHHGIGVDEMAAVSDTLWVADWDSIRQLDAQSLKKEKIIEFPESFMGPRLLIVTKNGVWVDGLSNWIYYDGTEWTFFESYRGVSIDEIAPSIHHSQDGRYWFLARGFLLVYEPTRQSVQAYVQDLPRQDPDSHARFVVAEYNGDLFGARVAADMSPSVVFPDGWAIVFDETLFVRQLKEMPFISPAEYAGMAVGADGSIWIADAGHVSRFIPETEQWIDYDPRHHDPALQMLMDLAAASDGSIWLTDGRYVVHVVPLSATTNESLWENYDSRDGFTEGSAYQIGIGIDDTIWIGGSKVLNQCKLLPVDSLLPLEDEIAIWFSIAPAAWSDRPG